MKVWTINDPEIDAKKIGVELYNKRRVGRALAFVLRPISGNETYRAIRNAPYKASGQRKAWAICWHGHRDFMRSLFEGDPGARIKTVMADYVGKEGFERNFPETGLTNIGSQVFPLYAGQACACEESGIFMNDDEKAEHMKEERRVKRLAKEASRVLMV